MDVKRQPDAEAGLADVTHATARYCDGGSYMGDKDGSSTVDGQTVYFRGKSVLEGVMKTLLYELVWVCWVYCFYCVWAPLQSACPRLGVPPCHSFLTPRRSSGVWSTTLRTAGNPERT